MRGREGYTLRRNGTLYGKEAEGAPGPGEEDKVEIMSEDSRLAHRCGGGVTVMVRAEVAKALVEGPWHNSAGLASSGVAAPVTGVPELSEAAEAVA